MPRRKTISVVELVSEGSPVKMHAGPSTVYQISPKAKRVSELKHHQCGIKKTLSSHSAGATLLMTPEYCDLLAAHVQSAVDACVQETTQRLRAELIGATTAQDFEYVVSLRNAKVIRVLLDMFLKKHCRKVLLQELKSSVNKEYQENNVMQRVQDLVAETKNVLTHEEDIGRRSKRLCLIESLDKSAPFKKTLQFISTMHPSPVKFTKF